MARLQTIEYNGSYVPWAVASCVICLVLFLVNRKIVSLMYPQVNNFTSTQKVDLSTRATSTFHALVVTTLCVLAFIYEEDLASEPIWLESPLVRATCAIVAGYLMSDLILVSIYYKDIGEMFFIFHHLASLYAYYYVMSYGVLPYFANFRLLAEFSTPFVNMRWLFDALGRKRTELPVFVNGISMTLSFFLCRILAMPVYWYKVYTVYGTEDFTSIGHIQYVLLISCVVLDVINIFWFNRMFKGVKKVLSAIDWNSNVTSKDK